MQQPNASKYTENRTINGDLHKRKSKTKGRSLR